MRKIAVLANDDSCPYDFFESDRILIFERVENHWKTTEEKIFNRIVPSSPSLTRRSAADLLQLLEDCDIIAGIALVGIPYAVFNRAGFHIFEINSINDDVLDEIISDIEASDSEKLLREKTVKNAGPAETDIPGIYSLDLVALQTDYPEISSKMAMSDFLENTTFMELHLTCRHIPPWIENTGKYNVQEIGCSEGINKAIISRKC